MTRDLLSITETAQLLGCSVHNIRKLIIRAFNPLPYHKPIGSKVLINNKVVELPEELITKTKNKNVFVRDEVNLWIKNQ